MERIGAEAVLVGYQAYIQNLKGMESATQATAKAIDSAGKSSSGAAKGLDDAGKAGSQASKGMSEAAKSAEAADKAFDKVQKTSAIASVGFLGLIGASAKFASDFEHEMSQVGAVAQASDKDMEQLRGTALKLGADTAFSASEAASAMEELAQGGRSVAQIVGGEANAAVSLAAAGNYGLADSARTIAVTMDVWKGTQLQTNDVVNRLAAAANVSRFSVDDMSAAIGQAGGVAAALGVSFQDTSTALAATASSFNSGSDAGTSFKTFLLGLDGTTDKAKETIKQYGLNFRDATGHLKPMAEIVEELRGKIGTLGEAEQVAALKTVFGNDAYRTAAGLMRTSGDEFKAMSDKMGATNAADIAKQRMDNLSGGVEQLKGSLETLGIAFGQQFIPMLTDASGVATEAVNAFGELPTPLQNTIVAATGIVVALPAVIGLIEKGAGAFKTLGSALETTPGKLTAVGIGLTALAVGADLVLQGTTGHGLFERIFGDVGKADASSAALDHFNAVMAGTHSPTERLNAAMADLASTSRELAAAGGEAALGQSDLENALLGSDNRLFGFDVGLSDGVDKLNEFNSRTSVAATELAKQAFATLDAGRATELLMAAHDALLPSQVKAFEAATNYNEILRAQAVVQQNAINAATQSALGIDAVTAAVVAAGAPIGDLTDYTKGVLSAGDRWAASLLSQEDGAKKLSARIQELTINIANYDPLLGELAIKHGNLAIEIERLEQKGNSLTASERERLTSLKDQQAAVDAQIQSANNLKQSYEGLVQGLQAVVGPGAAGAFIEAMQNAGRTSEEQRTKIGQVGEAFNLLSNGDIPGAAKAFQKLHDDLSAKEWAPIGTKIPTDIALGISGGQGAVTSAATIMLESAMLTAKGAVGGRAYDIGASLALGVGSGIDANRFAVVSAVDALVDQAIAAGKAAADAHSPSRRTAEQIGRPLVEGIVVGIQAAGGEAGGALAAFVESIVGDAKGPIEKLNDAMWGALGADPDKAKSAGQSLVSALKTAISAAESAGVPDAQELGANIMTALAEALATHTPEAITAAQDAMGALMTAIDVAGQKAAEAAKFSLANVVAAMGDISNDAALQDRLGSLGVSVMNALDKGIEEGGKASVQSMAKAANDVRSALTKNLPPAQAGYLGAQFMQALQKAIEENSPEAVGALQDVMARIKVVMDHGAIDVRTGVTVTGDEIKRLADLTHLSAGDIQANIGAIIDSGILPFIGKIKTVPPEVASLMGGVVKAFQEGRVGIEETIQIIIGLIGSLVGAAQSGTAAVNGIPKPASGSAPGGSGGGTSGPSTGGGQAPVWDPGYAAHPPEGSTWQVKTNLNGGTYQTMTWSGGAWHLTGGYPAYATGITNVPNDQLALVHKGEAIIPAAVNPWNTQTVGSESFLGGIQELTVKSDKITLKATSLTVPGLAGGGGLPNVLPPGTIPVSPVQPAIAPYLQPTTITHINPYTDPNDPAQLGPGFHPTGMGGVMLSDAAIASWGVNGPSGSGNMDMKAVLAGGSRTLDQALAMGLWRGPLPGGPARGDVIGWDKMSGPVYGEDPAGMGLVRSLYNQYGGKAASSMLDANPQLQRQYWDLYNPELLNPWGKGTAIDALGNPIKGAGGNGPITTMPISPIDGPTMVPGTGSYVSMPSSGGGAGSFLNFDFRGAVFTGTPDQIRDSLSDIIDGAFHEQMTSAGWRWGYPPTAGHGA